jgi:hypothetical protein
MLGSGNTGAVRAFVTAGSARGQDADLYRRYAAGVYRQALLTRGDRALAKHLACDVIVNECALARIPERGEDDARHRLTESVLRRGQQLARGAAAIYPRDMAAIFHALMHTRIHYDHHHGSRRSGAWAGGGQIAAGCATVPNDKENLVM